MAEVLKIHYQDPLVVTLDYDGLTAGDLGNTLVRLQAALRGLWMVEAGRRAVRRPEDHFALAVASVSTGKSVELEVVPAFSEAVAFLGPEVWRMTSTILTMLLANWIWHKWVHPEIHPRPPVDADVEVVRGRDRLDEAGRAADELPVDAQRKVVDFGKAALTSGKSATISSRATEVRMRRRPRRRRFY